jgi:hypothetical protein
VKQIKTLSRTLAIIFFTFSVKVDAAFSVMDTSNGKIAGYNKPDPFFLYVVKP